MRFWLEMCPISNLRTAVVESIEAHPIRRLFDKGVVTVNTNDPKMFGNCLAEEFALLAERLAFTPDEVRALLLGGIDASCLSAEDKAALRASFLADSAWNE